MDDPEIAEILARYRELSPEARRRYQRDLSGIHLCDQYNEALRREWRVVDCTPVVLGAGVVSVTVAAGSPLVLRRIPQRATVRQPEPEHARDLAALSVFVGVFAPTYAMLEPLFEILLRQ